MTEPRRTPGGVPIIPDKVADKIKSGKKDWAIEEVLGEAAVERMTEENSARDAPIRADTLRPISRAEAAQRTTFNGQTLPSLPQTRRVLPAPFRRESISLTVPGEARKTWQNVRAMQVQEGDILPGIGVVTGVQQVVRRETVAGVSGVAVGNSVVISGPEHDKVFSEADQVAVFRF